MFFELNNKLLLIYLMKFEFICLHFLTKSAQMYHEELLLKNTQGLI